MSLGFSSSKSESSSEAYDQRAVASELGIAAGGNRGNINRDIFGDKNFYGGGKDNTKFFVGIAVVALIVWKFPVIKKTIKKVMRSKNG